MTALEPPGATVTTAAPDSPRRSRIAAIDIARGLAVLGMLAAHTFTRQLDEDTVFDGRSSILFAMLAGVSIGLMTGGDRPLRSDRGAAYFGIAVRGLLLWLLGTWLWEGLRTDILIILDYYGIAFLLLLPVLFAPRPVLVAVAAVAAFVGPVIDAAFDAVPVDDPALAYAVDRLFDGAYPAFTWLAYLAVGLLCARSGLARLRTRIAMVGFGTVGMVAGYGAAIVLPGVTADAHSDTTAEVLGSGGFAVTLVGVLLLLITPSAPGGRAVRTLLSPIAAVGSMPLTIYTAQLLGLALYILLQPEPSDIEYPLSLFFAMAVAAILFAVLWRRFMGAGPLERLMKSASGWPPSRPGPSASSQARGY